MWNTSLAFCKSDQHVDSVGQGNANYEGKYWTYSPPAALLPCCIVIRQTEAGNLQMIALLRSKVATSANLERNGVVGREAVQFGI
jgi:hypothetical protein